MNKATHPQDIALIVVDVQRYYLDPESVFVRYHQFAQPGCVDYIADRCREVVLPNIARLLAHFRRNQWPVVFLRLCGREEDRSDMHESFRQAHRQAEASGYYGMYPLVSDPFSEVMPELAPLENEHQVLKTTYSGFTSSNLEEVLRELAVRRLVFTGLATSQCVDTSARDAADRGYEIIHVEDAQADYHDLAHRAALIASRAVCGGVVSSTSEVLEVLSST